MRRPPLGRARWQAVDVMFQRALDMEPQHRTQFLQRACGGDRELLDAVERLLRADARSRDFLETPVELACDLPWDDVLDITGGMSGADQPVPSQGESERAGERMGPYRLLRQLARGGMATVYLAERVDGQWQQEVALKVIRRGLDTEDVVRRFLAERQILSSLHHPNIAQLLDGGTTDDGLPFLAMEHVQGTRITDYCDNHRLPLEARMDLFRDVGRAVQAAHRNLVVHRDIKPSNILVDNDGHAKLLDFGIAKLLDASIEEAHTQTGSQLLTPEYASPEQMRGDTITTASDVYQLGVLLCQLLSGRRPYQVRAFSPAQIEAQILEAHPTKPSDLATDDAAQARGLTRERLRRRLHGDLDTIVLKAISKEPERRYPSAEALVNDVERYLRGRTILARPDSWRYRAGKWLRRNSAAAVVGVTALALVVGWSATATVQSRTLARERDRVLEEARRTAEVRDFLASLFEASDPYLANARHPDSITARELLDAGSRRLDQLAGDPSLRAELAFTIGRTYRRLGLNERATAHLQDALALHRELAGDTGPPVAFDLFELGMAQSKPDSSIDLLERALVVAEAALEPSHLLLAEILTNLANKLTMSAGADSTRNRALHQRALAILETNPEATRVQYANALKLSVYGRRDVITLTEVLAIQRESYGDLHPAVAGSLNDLALATEPTDPLRADSLLTEALLIDEATLGQNHPTTQMVINNLAAVKRDRGDFENAVPLYRRAGALRREYQPDRRVGLAYMTYGLGVSLMGLGLNTEAEIHIRETITVLSEEMSALHPLVFRASTTLATCLRQQGRLAEAEQMLTGLRARFQEADLQPALRASVLDELAAVYAAQGRGEERTQVERAAATLRSPAG